MFFVIQLCVFNLCLGDNQPTDENESSAATTTALES